MRKLYLLSLLIIGAPLQAGVLNLAEKAGFRTVRFVGDHPIVFASAIPLLWFGIPSLLAHHARKLIKSQDTIETEARALLSKLEKRYESLPSISNSPSKLENVKLFAVSFQKQYRDHEANWAEKFHSKVTATYNKLGHYPLIFLARHLKQDIAATQWYASHSKDAECKSALEKMGQSLQGPLNLIRTAELFAQEQANVIQEKNRSYLNVSVFLGLSALGIVGTGHAYDIAQRYNEENEREKLGGEQERGEELEGEGQEFAPDREGADR